MSLSSERCKFTDDLADLLIYNRHQGINRIAINEVVRSQAQADMNAASGAGIKNSLHLLGLAADLILYGPDGEYLDKTEDYTYLGDYWKSLDPLNRWGGDFTTRKDGNHFSRSYQGRA